MTTAIGSQDDEAFAVGVGAKGLIVAAGATTGGGGSTSDFAAVRYTAKGVPDRTSATAGIATAHFEEPAAANQVLLGADGSVLLAGAATPSLATVDSTHLDVALAQLTNRGVLDTAFGTNGQTLLKLGTSSARPRACGHPHPPAPSSPPRRRRWRALASRRRSPRR